MSEFLTQNDPQKARLIMRFMGQIARATRHHQQLSQAERQNLVADYTEMLMRRSIPGFCYGMDGLAFVLNGLEWFPTLNTLAALLEEYRTTAERKARHAGHTLRINNMSGRALTHSEQAWLRFWQNGESLHWATQQGEMTVDERTQRRRRANALSLLKRYAPFVWRSLTSAHEARGNDWTDPQHIRRSLRELDGHPMHATLVEMLRAAVAKHAPHNLHLIDTPQPMQEAV